MKKVSPSAKELRIQALKVQAEKLRAQVLALNRVPSVVEPIVVGLQKTQENFYKIRDPKGSDDMGLGKYLLLVDVTAGKDTLYIPVSIASGRKSAGFIYVIEGTAGGTGVASITFKGDGTTTVTSGSISYCKIPAGKMATFKILAEVTGRTGRVYKVVLSRINYKLNPNDLRYKKFLTDVSTDTLKFR